MQGNCKQIDSLSAFPVKSCGLNTGRGRKVPGQNCKQADRQVVVATDPKPPRAGSNTDRTERISERQPDDWDQDDWRDDDERPAPIRPLSHDDAVSLFGERALRPSRMTPGKVVLAQVAVTLLSAIGWAVFGPEAGPYGWSALFGGAVCCVPSAFFAFRLWLARDRASIGGLVIGEAIKVLATVALFVLVVVLYRDLRWVPMLVTFLLALKTYWVALAIR